MSPSPPHHQHHHVHHQIHHHVHQVHHHVHHHQVCWWDTRTGGKPEAEVSLHNSHIEPVYKVDFDDDGGGDGGDDDDGGGGDDGNNDGSQVPTHSALFFGRKKMFQYMTMMVKHKHIN